MVALLHLVQQELQKGLYWSGASYYIASQWTLAVCAHMCHTRMANTGRVLVVVFL